ncbi:acyltransferase family protein [Cellulomonas fengjieae]|uniref:acyltransferase family protein n=1 Tax=Cellulomonas fengjieae TaxID=2819978 RepID=UPI001AAE4CC0|nr:acyltransferase [Cellulomonas fengjieae]MBO3101390.1 acyltransferase [Cellulomonas fengjieae]
MTTATTADTAERPDLPDPHLTPNAPADAPQHHLDPSRNSLNQIRLVLATAVLFHHAFPLGGFAGHPSILGVQLGGWAVFGFFAISGYLISASRKAKPLGQFLVLRVARIYPAFWVCLAATAFVLAPIVYVRNHATLDGFLTTGPVTPANYILVNATLQIGSYGIGDTLISNPYPVAWNGSLWTLFYEFLCYLLIGALGILGIWRRNAWPVAAGFLLSVLAFANVELLLPYVGGNPDVRNFAGLVPFFLGGALVHALKHRLPLTWIGAAVGAAVTAALTLVAPSWGLALASPFMLYTLLWLGSTVPSPGLLRRHDISYGVYIYAFPVQQLLAALGVADHGLLPYTLATIAITFPLAAASWLLVERPIMRRARR